MCNEDVLLEGNMSVDYGGSRAFARCHLLECRDNLRPATRCYQSGSEAGLVTCTANSDAEVEMMGQPCWAVRVRLLGNECLML